MELACLVKTGLLEPRETTGTLQTLPLTLQHVAASQLIEHLAADDMKANLKKSIRCDEDLRYLIETIGCTFAFSAAEFGVVLRKALDIYAVLMTPPFMDDLAPFNGPNRETFLCDMFRHQSQLFEPRADHPAGSAAHILLIGRLLNYWSVFVTAHEGDKLKEESWHLILRTAFGVLNYTCVAPNTFAEVRSAISSVVLEILVRSKIRDETIWNEVVRTHIPKGYATLAQWGTIIVALSRSVSALLSSREIPPATLVYFKNMPDNVRKEIKFGGYSETETTFIWKKLLTVFGELHLIEDEDALEVASQSLRNVVILTSCSTYWRTDVPSCELYNFRKPQPPAEKLLPPNPTTESLISLAANNAFKIAMRKPPAGAEVCSATLNRAKSRAIETVCAIFLRRESEASCDKKYLQAFFNFITTVASDEPMWPTLLQNTVSIYMLNLPIPTSTLSTLSSVVCSFFFQEEAGQGEEDDDDLAGEDPSAEDEAIVKAAVLECAAHHAAGLFSWASMENEQGVMASLSAALLCGVEAHSKSVKLLHQLLCTIVLCVTQRPKVVIEQTATYSDIAENVMALLRAPFGTYPLETLCMAVDFLSWIPAINEGTTITIVVSLSTFCQSIRRLEGQVDGEELSSLFACTSTALSRLINSDRSLLTHDAVALSVLRVVDTGSKPLSQPELQDIRNSAMRLYYVFINAMGWPHAANTSAISHNMTEEDFVDRAVMFKLFEINGSRIVTALEILPDGATTTDSATSTTEKENEVVLIIRDAFVRKVYRFRRNVTAAASPDPLLPLPNLNTTERHELPVDEDVTDVLRFIQNEQRTDKLIDSWKNEESMKKLINELHGIPEEKLDTEAFREEYRHLAVADQTASCCKLIRFLFSDLGFVSSRTHELPVDEEIIASIKGLDQIDAREHLDIPVVFVGDDVGSGPIKVSPAFERFMDGLGWLRDDDGSSLTTMADEAKKRTQGGRPRFFMSLVDSIAFHPAAMTASQFHAEEVAADTCCSRKSVEDVKVRIIWDATFAKYNWAATNQPLHDLFSDLNPQFRAVENTRYFDIIVTPLTVAGLYSVKLQFPRGLNIVKQIPWLWGAPLLHGSLLSAQALPKAVRTAAHHATLQRDKCSGRHVSPLLIRRQAIRNILSMRHADPAIDTLPTQALVSLCDGLVPKRSDKRQQERNAATMHVEVQQQANGEELSPETD